HQFAVLSSMGKEQKKVFTWMREKLTSPSLMRFIRTAQLLQCGGNFCRKAPTSAPVAIPKPARQPLMGRSSATMAKAGWNLKHRPKVGHTDYLLTSPTASTKPPPPMYRFLCGIKWECRLAVMSDYAALIRPTGSGGGALICGYEMREVGRASGNAA